MAEIKVSDNPNPVQSREHSPSPSEVRVPTFEELCHTVGTLSRDLLRKGCEAASAYLEKRQPVVQVQVGPETETRQPVIQIEIGPGPNAAPAANELIVARPSRIEIQTGPRQQFASSADDLDDLFDR